MSIAKHMGRLVVASLAALAVFASPAAAAGTLNVSIAGAGKVTASGIDCHRAINAKDETGDCAQAYDNVRECIDGPLKPVCFFVPPFVTVTPVANATGFAFEGWTGACAGQAGACTVEMDGDARTTAVFRDVQDPTVVLAPPGTVLRGTVALSATASDNAGVARVDFSVGGRTVSDSSAPYAVSIDTTGLNGATSASAVAVDTAGRTKTATANVVVDNGAPSLVVNGPNGVAFAPGSTQTWTLVAADAVSGVKSVACSVVAAGSPAAFGTCTGGAASHSVSGKGEGAYTFTARVTDLANNVVEVVRGFSIDGTPPVTTVSSGVADGAVVVGTSLSWAFAASEAGVTFSCRVYPAALTPGAFAPCSEPAAHSASGFAPGVYAFEVRAVDAVGNVEAAPVKRVFTVVSPPPAVPVGSTGSAGFVPSNLASAKSGANQPQIVVTLAFSFSNSTKRKTRLTSLVVKGVPAGSSVTASCAKRCAKKRFKRAGASGNVSLKGLIKKPLKAGTKITVVVSKPGMSSAIKILKVLPRKSPVVTTQCRPSSAPKPRAC